MSRSTAEYDQLFGFVSAAFISLGGFIGFLKRGSIASLVAGSGSGALLAYGVNSRDDRLVTGVAAVLLLVMGKRFINSKKVMPAGLVVMSRPDQGYVSPGYKGPIKSNPGDGESAIVIYGYVPSLALGIVAIVTFGIALIGHLWRTVQSKQTRTFHALFVTGCLLELVGYGSRLYSHYSPFKVNGFVINYFFIVVAPIAIQAALYIALASAVRRICGTRGKGLLGFNPRWMVIGMIIADVITTLVQVAGASLLGTAESNLYQGKDVALTPEQANNILLAGLALQTAAFVIFILLLTLCVLRSRNLPSSLQIPRKLSLLLFISSFLLLLRTTFRLAESASGIFSYASTSEGLFGGLEFTPVMLTTWVWVVVPLKGVLPRMIKGGEGGEGLEEMEQRRRLEEGI
ncbi:uncharacterized protein JCM6883_004600 [Sporobolomyces salmoneus]|uniref:uncharacterized protein n=1 Tax=Sporobolomyces salmoneus TaxID=183962 RepID=UPI003176FF41